VSVSYVSFLVRACLQCTLCSTTTLAREFSRFEHNRTLLDVDKDRDYKTERTKH